MGVLSSSKRQQVIDMEIGTRTKRKALVTLARKNVPRLIVFIMGGATYAEFRIGYEVSNEKKNWEVIVGGSQILTPEGFLDNIKQLSSGASFAEGDDEQINQWSIRINLRLSKM